MCLLICLFPSTQWGPTPDYLPFPALFVLKMPGLHNTGIANNFHLQHENHQWVNMTSAHPPPAWSESRDRDFVTDMLKLQVMRKSIRWDVINEINSLISLISQFFPNDAHQIKVIPSLICYCKRRQPLLENEIYEEVFCLCQSMPQKWYLFDIQILVKKYFDKDLWYHSSI